MKRNSDLLRTMMSTLLKKVLRKRKRKVVMESSDGIFREMERIPRQA